METREEYSKRRRLFQSHAQVEFKECTSRSTYISREEGQRFIEILLGKVKPTLNEKDKIRKRSFQLRTKSGKHFLYAREIRKPKTKEQDSIRKIVFIENWFKIIDKIHAQNGHPGIMKTFQLINAKYTGVAQRSVLNFVRTCPICPERQFPSKEQ